MCERQIDDLLGQERLINHTHSFAMRVFLPPHCRHITQVLFVSHRKGMLLSSAYRIIHRPWSRLDQLGVWYHTQAFMGNMWTLCTGSANDLEKYGSAPGIPPRPWYPSAPLAPARGNTFQRRRCARQTKPMQDDKARGALL